MVTIEEVKEFLDQFNVKAQIFGIRFRNDREKNKETLRRLEISPLQREVYIKITLGYENGQTICISFHISEKPLIYPYK